MNPAVTRTIWVTRCCWLATALKEAKTTGSSKTGQENPLHLSNTTCSIIYHLYKCFLSFVLIWINVFFFLVGVPAGVKVATCEWSEMAATLVASRAMPCTLSYDSDQTPQSSVYAKLFHWTVSGCQKTTSVIADTAHVVSKALLSQSHLNLQLNLSDTVDDVSSKTLLQWTLCFSQGRKYTPASVARDSISLPKVLLMVKITKYEKP